jgi:sulfide dehydrogenase cytochrome subunit
LIGASNVHADDGTRKARLAAQGEALAQPCMSCHGTRGASTQQAIPTIGGQIESYLVSSMNAFRDESRPSTIMARIAKAYSNREVGALAAYFSRQPFARPAQPADPEKVARGEAIHRRYCARCHLHDAWDSSEAEDNPRLAGQKLEYLRRNMEDIVTGKRTVDIDMQGVLQRTTPDDIDAVLNFYAAQHGDSH